MNDKTREQIEAMKMQTIGVEVEMNNITREKAARKVAEFFGTTARTSRAGFGNSSETSASTDRKLKSARW